MQPFEEWVMVVTGAQTSIQKIGRSRSKVAVLAGASEFLSLRQPTDAQSDIEAKGAS